MAQKGIDHLVLPVRDLARAAEQYRRMGFTLTPRAGHPWGTANMLAQFEGNFLELLTVADAGQIPEHGLGQFSFGAFNRDFLEAREGFSMLVMDSGDARADREAFARAGLKTYLPFDFARKAMLPSGEETEVAFTLAFAMDPKAPEAAFFTCQQHAPEFFWKPDYQRHANGARRVSRVVMVSPEPAQHAQFLSAFTGADAVTVDGGIEFQTARGIVAVLDPKAAFGRYGRLLPYVPANVAMLAGFHVAVGDPGAVRAILGRSGIGDDAGEGRIGVSAREAFGAMLVFEAA